MQFRSICLGVHVPSTQSMSIMFFLGSLGEWFNPPAWKVGVSAMAP
tara:strand:- start:2125 stop:2262 length:138 start_codon:yes stop_codon:yes gene_type:complete